jgi:hypothetical protein
MAFLGESSSSWNVLFDVSVSDEDESIFSSFSGPSDIYPMRPGHTLLIPKTHVVRLADLDPTSAGKMGMALPKVVNAVCEATGNPDLNVVCNQGYAQAVHVSRTLKHEGR